MRTFTYWKPQTESEIEKRLLESGIHGRVIAGGTDLTGTLREKILPYDVETIISMKGVNSLKKIGEKEDFISLGAMVTLSDLAKSEKIQQEYPLLAKAAAAVASPQLRNVATLGGNLCQEPRCWYYRYQGNKYNCIRKGGTVCNAIVGRNEHHSIFGSMKVKASGCTETCPNGTPVAEYMEALRQGKIAEAAAILADVNPMAAVTGRICPHTCENGCGRGDYDESVAIREAERFLGDYILDYGLECLTRPEKSSGKTVAIIGAGPAGLTAAFEMIRRGHKPVIIDQNSQIGGMLYYGIPAYRLPKHLLSRIGELLSQLGAQFKMGQKVGRDVSMEQLRQEYDCLLVTVGAWKSKALGCKGVEAKGVMGGIEFLNLVASKTPPEIGKKVVVIGGGNTAMDACRTAKRLGAETVTVAYRRTESEMPAEAKELQDALEEGINLMTLAAPGEIIMSDSGHVKAVRMQQMCLGEPDASGRRSPVPMQDQEQLVEADFIIAAVGQDVDAQGLGGHWEKKDGIFAAGDCVTGAATAIEAIAGARAVSEAIHRFLTPCVGSCSAQTQGGGLMHQPCGQSLCRSHAVKPAELDASQRSLISEDVSGIGKEALLEEAIRCLNCGCVAVSPTDVGTALGALDAIVITNRRAIPIENFFKAGIASSTVLDVGEFVTEILLPKRQKPSLQAYEKYRTRKSIDFPIVSMAISLGHSNGVVCNARISLGAVAPVPLRMKEVEAYLEGKMLSRDTVEKAAELLVKDCVALAENLHKIRVLKVLFRRRLMDMSAQL